MRTDHTVDWFALESYYTGASTAEERARIERWLGERPEHRVLGEKVAQALAVRAEVPQRDWRRAEARDAILSRIRAGKTVRTPRVHIRPSMHVARWVGVSAAVLVAVVGGRVAFDRFVRAPQRPAHVYATAAAQLANVTLEDGSRVTLAPNSRLEVPTDFGAHARTISLVGQALFDVPSSKGTPFVVRTGAVSTRVLGTEFSVRRYATDDIAHIVVVSGKVSAGGRRAVTVPAGVVAWVTDSSATTARITDTLAYVGWANGGALDFHNAPLTEVLSMLSHWYGYEFRLSDSVSPNQNVTAALSTQSSAKALSSLGVVLQIDFRFEGNVVTLVPRREPRAQNRPTRKEESLTRSAVEVGR